MTVGNDLVLYVATTPSGYKVQYRDGRGLSDGSFSKGYTRYFYGETAKQDALAYAENKADRYDEYRVKTAHNVGAEA